MNGKDLLAIIASLFAIVNGLDGAIKFLNQLLSGVASLWTSFPPIIQIGVTIFLLYLLFKKK